jgi:phage tail protein X
MRVTVLQGDSLDQLCQRHLGMTASVTEQVLEMNPGLAALGAVLPMGTQIDLPDQIVTRKNTTLIQLWD